MAEPKKHPPCSACGAADSAWWICDACNKEWEAERLSGVPAFIRRKRIANGLPQTDDWWDGMTRQHKRTTQASTGL